MSKILGGAISQFLNTFLFQSDVLIQRTDLQLGLEEEKKHLNHMIFHTVHYLGYKRKYSNKERANKETKGEMTHEKNQNPNVMMVV